MTETDKKLQVLIANEREGRLAVVTRIVDQLGHEIVASGTDIKAIGRLSREQLADVALVGAGDHVDGLVIISEIVHEAACPVIALLDTADSTYIDEAAKRGVFAYVIMNGNDRELEHAIDITLRRFAEFNNLQGAFGRRAVIEQAKGILMARNGVNADDAYQLLKSHSQQTGKKLIDVAQAIIQFHELLPATTATPQSQPPH